MKKEVGMTDNPIIITGGKRTGTRMVAQIVEKLGVYFGEKKDLGDRYEHKIIQECMTKRDFKLDSIFCLYRPIS